MTVSDCEAFLRNKNMLPQGWNISPVDTRTVQQHWSDSCNPVNVLLLCVVLKQTSSIALSFLLNPKKCIASLCCADSQELRCRTVLCWSQRGALLYVPCRFPRVALLLCVVLIPSNCVVAQNLLLKELQIFPDAVQNGKSASKIQNASVRDHKFPLLTWDIHNPIIECWYPQHAPQGAKFHIITLL